MTPLQLPQRRLAILIFQRGVEAFHRWIRNEHYVEFCHFLENTIYMHFQSSRFRRTREARQVSRVALTAIG